MIEKHREWVFTALLGAWAFGLLFLTPPFQVADENMHFTRAWQVSELTFMASKEGPELGGILPEILKPDRAKFDFLPFNPNAKLSYEQFRQMRRESPRMNAENLSQRSFQAFANTALYSPVPYMFSAAGLGAARLFSVRVIKGFYIGRIFNLLAALAIFYGALKLLGKLPEWQLMIFLVAALPMMAFQLMSYSADSTTFVFAVLVLACIGRLRHSWSPGVYGLLLLASILLGLCKQTYVLLPTSVLLCWRSLPGSRAHKFGWALLVMAAAALPMLAWSKMVQPIFVPHLKNVHIDPVAQAVFFLQNWTVLVSHFFEVLFYDNAKFYWETMYGCLGWLDTALPYQNAEYHWALLFASMIVPVSRENSLSIPLKFWQLLVVMGSILLICISIYLSWNAVGVIAIAGIQGRYFLPLIPFFMVIFYRLAPISIGPTFYYVGFIPVSIGVCCYLNWTAATIVLQRYWIP